MEDKHLPLCPGLAVQGGTEKRQTGLTEMVMKMLLLLIMTGSYQVPRRAAHPGGVRGQPGQDFMERSPKCLILFQ